MSAGDSPVTRTVPQAPPSQLPMGGTYRLTVRHIFLASAFVLLLLAVVIPNSLPIPTAAMMGLTCLFALPGFRFGQGIRNLLTLYIYGVIVSIIYLIVGGMHDAPLVGLAQIAAVYIVSPLAWILIADGLCRYLDMDRLIEWFVMLTLLCAASVALFFYLFLRHGASAVAFFFEGANVNLNEGFSGATMHVYGSMIFLAGGFFSSPELIKHRVLRFALLGMLFICALTSGRSALILSVPTGFVLGMLLSSRTVGHAKTSVITRTVRYGLPLTIAVVAVLFLLQAYTKISLPVVINAVTSKVASGGGDARSQMGASLYAGILENGGLGSGHGVGVRFVSDALHPWRYELVWLATLYRVGLLGTIIYVLPFFLYVAWVVKLAISCRLTSAQKFMFSGFVCAFLGTNTNPYIEAFSLQWMYAIPLVAMFVEYPMILKRMPK
ncbi:hypothetical protein [Dyella telluris]|uniref:O-antigen ligase domain-containing protein n=1 Tax=Dyella telluris TaxID=2763498 RepID=A0A7G8Q2Q3_9GAMM|nr:hypothetical protein [Dyella telluris]QNK01061.1 hypothetical protein H8F01_18650 [Dyella telluris]